jgi:hypothetical protein
VEQRKTPIRRCAIYTRKSSEEGSSRASTHYMRSARRAKRSSRARLVKDGVSSRPPMTMAGCPVARWNDQRSSVC